MTSIILRAASRFLITLLLLYSFFLLIRGHNAPGGGFVGGLVAAAAWALYGIAFGESSVRRSLGVSPTTLIGAGILLAVLSGVAGAAKGAPFLTGVWISLEAGTPLHLGTPLLFDAGVYLTVLGTTLTIILVLEEEN